MNKLLVASVIAAFAAPAIADPLQCRTLPNLVGACHVVRGELQLFDGTPSARIHVMQSRQVLGVISNFDADNETFVAPREVRDAASFDAKLVGRFEVCPLDKVRPGRMQTVCIAGATGMKSVPLK